MMTAAFFRMVPADFSWLPSGPASRAAGLALCAVLLWSTWPMLATIAQPAPSFLMFGLAAAVGFGAAFGRAALAGQTTAFLSVRPATLVFVAAALFANNLLYLLAMPRIGPAEANVIAYLWPVILAGLGAVVGRSPLTMLQALGIALAFAGAAVVIGPRLNGEADLLGIGFAFASGLVFAIYALVRSYGQEIGEVIGPSMGLIAIVCLALHFLFEPAASLTLTQTLAIAGIGLAPLSLSNMLWDKASRTGHLPLISAIAYLTPLGALLLLSMTGAADVTWAAAAGAVLIVAGAFAAANVFNTNTRSRP